MAKRKAVKAGTSAGARAARVALFVEAMLVNNNNQTQAAVAAGYKPGRASELAGWRLMKDVVVLDLLERRRAEVIAAAREKSKLTAEEVIASLARDLRFDPSKLYTETGALKKIHEIDEDTRLALRSIEVEEIKSDGAVVGYTTKVKFPEKTTAREQGMKHFGLYEKDNRQRSDPITALLAAIESRESGFEIKP